MYKYLKISQSELEININRKPLPKSRLRMQKMDVSEIYSDIIINMPPVSIRGIRVDPSYDL